jgi:hypothetical protein
MANVAKFDPNYKAQQNATSQSSPEGSCVTADKLGELIDVAKFNKMMSKTTDTVNNFLDSYIQQQNDIKNNTANKNLELELDRYRQTALNERRIMMEKQQKMITELNQLYGLYESQLQSAKNTADLYKMLSIQNMKLKQIIENKVHTIEISDRKTYYENEQNGWVSWWVNIFTKYYKYLIIIIILGVVFKQRYRERNLWVLIIALALYPTVANYIIEFIRGIYNWILSDTKWVYLYSKM